MSDSRPITRPTSASSPAGIRPDAGTPSSAMPDGHCLRGGSTTPGRLIRSAEDTGVIALLDRRFLERPYRDHLPADWLPEEGAGALVLASEGMSGGVQGVAFSPDGTQVMGGEGDISRVLTWDVAHESGGEWAAMASSPDGAWDPLVTAPDGRHVLTAGPSRSVTMYDPRDGTRIRQYGGDQPAHFVSAGDGLAVAGRFDGGDGTARGAGPARPGPGWTDRASGRPR